MAMQNTRGKRRRATRGPGAFIGCMLAGMLACLLLAGWALSGQVARLNQASAQDDARRLYEWTRQTAENVQLRLDATLALAGELARRANDAPGDTAALLARARAALDSWRAAVSDILLHAPDGGVTAAGGLPQHDISALAALGAPPAARTLRFADGVALCTLPITPKGAGDTGSAVALSVACDLRALYADAAFPGADMRLTDADGVTLCALTTTAAPPPAAQGADAPASYAGADGRTYLRATAALQWGGDTLHIACVAPREALDGALRGFSARAMLIVMSVLALFALSVLAAFYLLYSSRKRSFDSALVARERMFDLLVANTRTAFALYSAASPEPLYLSSNTGRIIGKNRLRLKSPEAGYRMCPESGEEDAALRTLNLELSGWDGKSDFISGFTPCTQNGITRYYTLRIHPVRESPDEIVVIAQDVTQDREREETLKGAMAMADSANRAKTRFLANMSHDIRTPMNAIINMTAFAIESADDREKQLEYLNTIREASDHLLYLINDILDMSRIESGQAIVAREPFDLRDMLGGVCDMFYPLCAGKGQTFEANIDGIRTTRVLGDRLKVSQVLINLLNNAHKFTRRGGFVRLTATEAPSLRPDTAAFRFTVRDNGIGIPPEELEHIFEPFVRVENAHGGPIEGTGLGLSICKSFVTAMGGALWCESAMGEGSAFTADLYFAKARDTDAPAQEAPPQAVSFVGRRALLCEDNPVNQRIAAMLLQRYGFTVDTAANGEQAVERFSASPTGYYDIIYMDIQMPGINGYEATAAIRLSGHNQAETIPIVAMTANVFAQDVEQARAAGMNGHIAKPLQLAELLLCTRQALGSVRRRRDEGKGE